MKDYLKEVLKDDKGFPSWVRVACSVVVLTGCFAIILQLLLAIAVILFTSKGMEELAHIEWLQPITLIGIGLTGKVAQKQIEKTNT
jgi:hypothetical protein